MVAEERHADAARRDPDLDGMLDGLDDRFAYFLVGNSVANCLFPEILKEALSKF